MNYCPKCKAALVRRPIDNKDRLQCSDASCGFIFWNNPIPVVAIIVEVAEGVILAHNRQAPKGVYSFITGFLEADEAPDEAAQRETQEELGLTSINTSFVGIYPFKRANQVIIAYHILATGIIQINEELDEYIIVKKEELLGWNETGKFEVGEWLNQLRILVNSGIMDRPVS